MKLSESPSVPAAVWRDEAVRGFLVEFDFGRLSSRLRELAGLRQDELAEITGLTQGFLSRLESGRARLTHIDRIVQYLDAVGAPPDLVRLPLRGAGALPPSESHGCGSVEQIRKPGRLVPVEAADRASDFQALSVPGGLLRSRA
ncbi:helix-turn-helix transcriptional regulator [Kitasatospora sp. YST-16]|uniref:helix-turn-helix domain-containing protein n=1 Tax=Kitasatospora sp. YST-16 TaxID=2998080 RepID=UPI0022837C82|nr:helix-turn-helix transcriptional regulator [Kitasatospora sp. YST-16]WAL74543.1 helix-turn-helix transcriptional regulator [Kitasatospora sp. YST-16]WNW40601.1 helix-turn-helix transcriptional regulator [Streptomyces sp. Li-HN-5-13]